MDEQTIMTGKLQLNVTQFKQLLQQDETIIYRYFENSASTIQCCLLYIDGMVDRQIIDEYIVSPIIQYSKNNSSSGTELIHYLMNKVISVDDIQKNNNISDLLVQLFSGDSILLVEGCSEALALNTKGYMFRGIEEPLSETVVSGPREGFTESIMVNLSLIRRKIKSPRLKIKFKEIGSITKTQICICYIEGKAGEDILREIEKRVDQIKLEGVLDSQYIKDYLRDNPYTPFKTVLSTERPDIVVGKMLEGRVAILCDGTPMTLVTPHLFIEYFQVNEDYYQNFLLSTFDRLLRVSAFFLATGVPAIYVALTTYHKKLIPTPLIISIYGAREGVPFPTIIEAFLMLFTFELLREAGIRLPKYNGQAISIVGALVLGQAAVEASIVSAPMIIVVAVTGISAFLVPTMKMELILIRIIFLLLAGILGLYGYLFGVIGLFLHLFSMRALGVPYMLHSVSSHVEDYRDVVVRGPWWALNRKNKRKDKDIGQ